MLEARPSEKWRGYARRDWQRLALMLDAEDGQAAAHYLERSLRLFLEGWLLGQGWRRRSTVELEHLLITAREHEPTFVVFQPLAERVSRYRDLVEYGPDEGPKIPSVEEVRLEVGEATLLVRALFPDEELASHP